MSPLATALLSAQKFSGRSTALSFMPVPALAAGRPCTDTPIVSFFINVHQMHGHVNVVVQAVALVRLAQVLALLLQDSNTNRVVLC